MTVFLLFFVVLSGLMFCVCRHVRSKYYVAGHSSRKHSILFVHAYTFKSKHLGLLTCINHCVVSRDCERFKVLVCTVSSSRKWILWSCGNESTGNHVGMDRRQRRSNCLSVLCLYSLCYQEEVKMFDKRTSESYRKVVSHKIKVKSIYYLVPRTTLCTGLLAHSPLSTTWFRRHRQEMVACGGASEWSYVSELRAYLAIIKMLTRSKKLTR